MQRVIHLFQEGSFYRAYEWSAWLMYRYFHEFKVTHRRMKGLVLVWTHRAVRELGTVKRCRCG